MASEFLIPHPNIPTADIGLPKLKEVTVKNNENFLALDRLLHEFSSGMSSLDAKIEATKHDHPYAPLVHSHQLTDVEGLVPALEQKAPSVHAHPQYLTEVPAHTHTQAEVDGLLADLAGKADLRHKHNLDDVYSLPEALAGKASQSYVDWLESQMAKLTQSDTPLVDGNPQSGEGVIGTSEKAARADHRHPVNKTADVSNIKPDGSGKDGAPQIGTLYSYALTDHSHPLNYPSDKRTDVLAPDGFGENNTPVFGNSNHYADLYHSHPLNVGKTGTPADVAKPSGTASLGSSGYYARQDHVHKLPQLEQDDIKGLTDDLDHLDERITTLEQKPSGGGTVKSVAGVIPDNSGNVVMASLVAALRGTTSGTLSEGDHKHTHDKITDFDDSVRAIIDEDLTGYAKKDDFPVDDATGIPTEDNIFQHSHWASDIVVVSGTDERRLGSYFGTNNDLDGSQVRLSATGKWVKTNANTGRLEATDDSPLVADAASYSDDCLAVTEVGADGNNKVKSLDNPFTEEQVLTGMLYVTHNGDSTYNLMLKPPKFDKYGRFVGYGTDKEILGRIYAG